MSLLKANAVQLGQSITATNNFTWYQPASPDGTVRLGNGNSGSVTDLITVGTTGNLTFTGTTETYTNSVTISAASTRTLTLNGGGGSNGLVLTSGNLVGVGTASPDTHAQLTVNGTTQSSSASYAAFQLYNSALGTNPYFRIAYDSANNLVFNNVNTAYNSSTELMRLDSSGNLGLGVTPSAWSSSAKVLQFSGGSIFQYNSDRMFLRQNSFVNSSNSDVYTANGLATSYRQYNGQHDWWIAPNNTSGAGAACILTQAMTLDANGNLGIGTNSPSTKLQVNGGVILASFVGNNANNYLQLSDNNNASICTVGSIAGGNFYLYSAGYGAFYTGSTERVRIDSSGNLLVGTTGGGSRLTVYNSANNTTPAAFFAMNVSGDVGTAALLVSKYDNNSTTSQVFVRFSINQNGIANGQINANGASAAAFGSWSDIRLKENITALPSQLANICSLKPSEFDYKDGSGHQIGFIAQEMEEVYPDCIGEGADGMKTITGWSKTEARLVKAIQELSAEIEILKQKVN